MNQVHQVELEGAGHATPAISEVSAIFRNPLGPPTHWRWRRVARPLPAQLAVAAQLPKRRGGKLQGGAVTLYETENAFPCL